MVSTNRITFIFEQKFNFFNLKFNLDHLFNIKSKYAGNDSNI
jgi:hypothetical protein